MTIPARNYQRPTLSHKPAPGSNPGSGTEVSPANSYLSAVGGLLADSNPCEIWRAMFPPSPNGVSVYAIQMGDDGPIKIGVAARPWERIAALQTANPTRLRGLAAWRGSLAEEEALHRVFADDRLEGEWFKPSDALIAFIDLFGGGMSVDCAFFKPERCLSQRSLDLDKELMGMGTCEACGMEFPGEEQWGS